MPTTIEALVAHDPSSLLDLALSVLTLCAIQIHVFYLLTCTKICCPLGVNWPTWERKKSWDKSHAVYAIKRQTDRQYAENVIRVSYDAAARVGCEFWAPWLTAVAPGVQVTWYVTSHSVTWLACNVMSRHDVNTPGSEYIIGRGRKRPACPTILRGSPFSKNSSKNARSYRFFNFSAVLPADKNANFQFYISNIRLNYINLCFKHLCFKFIYKYMYLCSLLKEKQSNAKRPKIRTRVYLTWALFASSKNFCLSSAALTGCSYGKCRLRHATENRIFKYSQPRRSMLLELYELYIWSRCSHDNKKRKINKNAPTEIKTSPATVFYLWMSADLGIISLSKQIVFISS